MNGLEQERWLDAFELRWQRCGEGTEPAPTITEFLAQAGLAADADSPLVSELIRIDLEYRLPRQGDAGEASRWSLLSYRDELPDLRLRCDWVQEEIRWCERLGAKIDAATWLKRYPPDVFSSIDEHQRFVQLVDQFGGSGQGSTSHPTGQSTRVGQCEDVDGPAASSGGHARSLPSELDSWSLLRSRFRQDRLLGRGSFGTVWQAYDHQLQRSVAIKTLRSGLARDIEQREGLIREARSAAALNHPDLVTIHDVLVDEHQVHVVMQWIDGVPLDQWYETKIRDGRTLDSDRLLAEMLARISRAVHVAHLAGLVHCDLKPQNILVDAADNPTVLDFGLAIRRGSREATAGRIIGTPAYMPPEQTFGEVQHLDGRADVWSLGVILYRLLTGQPPFEAPGIEQLFAAIQTRPVTPCRQLRDQIAEPLQQVCQRCLAKRVDDRYSSAAELADQLEQFARGAPSLSRWLAPSGQVVGLPWSETRLIGRDDLIDRVVKGFQSPAQRLVTLSGGGGIGKTQSAAAIARRIALEQRMEVVWVELAAASDADQFAGAVLAALGVAQSTDTTSQQRVLQTLAVRGPLMIVLDNLEQIIDVATPLITQWLGHVASLRLLITSQAPLRVRGEVTVVVPPLRLTDDEALELFIERASEARSEFRWSPRERADGLEICRLVDGNPLAIELAASRTRVLSLADLRRRLESSFAVLKSHRSDRPDRHRTLHDVVRWSFELLDADQQKALLALAVWPAPLPSELVESLLESLDLDPLDRLEELTTRHLIRSQESSGTVWFSASAAVQRFATERIAPDQRPPLARHLIEQLGDRTNHDLTSGHSVTPLATNLLAASAWLPSSETSLLVTAVRLADELAGDQWDSTLRVARLEPCWRVARGRERSLLSLRLADAQRLAGRTRVAETILRELGEEFRSQSETNDIGLEIRRCQSLAMVCYRHGGTDEAIDLLRTAADQLDFSLALTGAPSDRETSVDIGGLIDVLLQWLDVERRVGRLGDARERLDRVDRLLQSWRSVDPNGHPAEAMHRQSRQFRAEIQRGKIAIQQGRIEEAWQTFDAAIQRCDAQSDQRDLQQALLGRAAAAAERGDYVTAGQDYDRCEKLCRRLGDLPTLAQVLNNRALAHDDAGDGELCRQSLRQALEIYRQLEDSVGVAIAMAAEAAAWLASDRPDQTIRILTSPEVQSAIPPDSLHHAIVLGDLGTAQARLRTDSDAAESLRACWEHLDRLEIHQSAERLIYGVELWRVLERLGDSGADEIRLILSPLIRQWPRHPNERSRVAAALAQYESLR